MTMLGTPCVYQPPVQPVSIMPAVEPSNCGPLWQYDLLYSQDDSDDAALIKSVGKWWAEMGRWVSDARKADEEHKSDD